jgi:long-chain acyl-CoA synthetase
MSDSTTPTHTTGSMLGLHDVPPTIVHRFWATVDRLSSRSALRRRGADGTWTSLSWADYGAFVRRAAAGLIDLGVQAGDRVGIMADNRVEWHVSDLAVLSVGAVSVPVYQTSSPAQAAQVLGDAGAVACFVDDADRLAKLRAARADLPGLRDVVLFDGPADDGVLTMDELLARGERALARVAGLVGERIDAIRPDGDATIVYTSGTTGPPKGAVLTHANIVFTVDAVTEVASVNCWDRFFSFLPLSHIAERIVSHFGQVHAGGETWFARSMATVAEDLHDCRPTVFFAVPRVWEKLHEAVLARTAHARGGTKVAIDRYFAVGEGHVATSLHEHSHPLDEIQWRTLDRFVGTKIRDGLGLDQARLLVSGAAPIDPSLLRWFHGVGLPITEVYGQTEDCGPATLNPPGHARIGTVGPPLPRVEIRIADDGEVLVRGGNVCRGYWNNDAATAALLEADGWMHTGDLGALDPDGWLRITGRKKDLIITSSGQNVAPQMIETRLRAEPLVGHVVVVGERRPYLTALVSLDPQPLARWAHEHHRLFDPELLAHDPAVVAEIGAAIERVNTNHARIEGIKRFRILPHELTMERGEMTPTMKVKRHVVLERYDSLISEMYAEPAP